MRMKKFPERWAVLCIAAVVTAAGAADPEPVRHLISDQSLQLWIAPDSRSLTNIWYMQDHVLNALPVKPGDTRIDDDLLWPDPAGDFELEFEFRIRPTAFAGVEYRRPGGGSSTNLVRGLMFSICDAARHPAARLGIRGNRRTGALFDLLPPAEDAPPTPLTEWNQARIVARGSRVEHWLNGVRVMAIDTQSPEFRALTAVSIFRDDPHYGQDREGRIALVRGDGGVAFRNMRLRRLEAASPGKN
jgi:hypothetical protein